MTQNSQNLFKIKNSLIWEGHVKPNPFQIQASNLLVICNSVQIKLIALFLKYYK